MTLRTITLLLIALAGDLTIAVGAIVVSSKNRRRNNKNNFRITPRMLEAIVQCRHRHTKMMAVGCQQIVDPANNRSTTLASRFSPCKPSSSPRGPRLTPSDTCTSLNFRVYLSATYSCRSWARRRKDCFKRSLPISRTCASP